MQQSLERTYLFKKQQLSMGNVNLNFLPHPKKKKKTVMFLLSNLQLLARVIFILKTQDLTQQLY